MSLSSFSAKIYIFRKEKTDIYVEKKLGPSHSPLSFFLNPDVHSQEYLKLGHFSDFIFLLCGPDKQAFFRKSITCIVFARIHRWAVEAVALEFFVTSAAQWCFFVLALCVWVTVVRTQRAEINEVFDLERLFDSFDDDFFYIGELIFDTSMSFKINSFLIKVLLFGREKLHEFPTILQKL